MFGRLMTDPFRMVAHGCPRVRLYPPAAATGGNDRDQQLPTERLPWRAGTARIVSSDKQSRFGCKVEPIGGLDRPARLRAEPAGGIHGQGHALEYSESLAPDRGPRTFVMPTPGRPSRHRRESTRDGQHACAISAVRETQKRARSRTRWTRCLGDRGRSCGFIGSEFPCD